MASFVATTVIRAPLERVFDYRLDLTNLPAYNPDVLRIKPDNPGPPQTGSAYRVRLRLSRWLKIKGTLTIGAVDRPRRLELAVKSIIDAREVCTFEEDSDGTRVQFETIVDTPGGPLAKVVDRFFVMPNTRRQVLRELDLMKRQLEAQP